MLLTPKELGKIKHRQVLARRACPIIIYSGVNGGGKSLAMVHDSLLSLQQGRRVLGTCCILDWSNPNAKELHADAPEGECNPAAHHKLFVKLVDYQQLLADTRNADVLADEVTGIASSRGSMTLPAEVADLFVQMRRRDAVLRVSTPNPQRCDVIIREVAQELVMCKGALRKKVVVRELDEATGEVVPVTKMWYSRRLFLWKRFDVQAYEASMQSKAQKARPKGFQLFWRPGSVAERAYDTYSSVSRLSTLTEHGMCLSCGGKRNLPKCSCDVVKVANRRALAG
jgi:hypothetical protein